MDQIPEKLSQYKQFLKFEEPAIKVYQESIEVLDSFIKGHTLALNHTKKKAANTTYFDCNDYKHIYHDTVAALNYYTKKCDEIIFDYEIKSLENMIDIVTHMKKFLLRCPKYILDVHKFVDTLDASARSDPNYKKVKRERRAYYKRAKYLVKKMQSVDYKSQIRLEYFSANNNYVAEFQYSPPGSFDDILAEYLFHSPVANIIYPTAKMLANGAPDSAVYTLSEFCNSVYSLLNLTNWQSKAIAYTAIVRFLFDQAYLIDSELFHYNKANAIFLQKAEAYSKQSVRDLKLTSDISRYYTPGLPVSSLFKSKQLDMLKQMELMTNPIDLMKHVHTIIQSLATYFGSETGMLSFDDTLTLLLALMSLSPPVNAVSICKFVEKWKDVQLDDIVGRSKDFFIAAVETLMTEEEMKIDGEEEDPFNHYN